LLFFLVAFSASRCFRANSAARSFHDHSLNS